MSDLLELPGVGPKVFSSLKSVGIESKEDLLNTFPFRYEDYSNLKQIDDVVDKEEISIVGTLTSKGQFRSRGGKLVTTLRLKQEKRSFSALWFNQSYIHKSVNVGDKYILAGKAKVDGRNVSLFAPKIREFTGESMGIVPIYHQSAQVRSSLLWRLNKKLLQDYDPEEILPDEILRQYDLTPLGAAYKMIHVPKKPVDFEKARTRFATDELLGIYLKSELNQAVWHSKPGYNLNIRLDDITKLLDAVPFKLTKSQHEAVMSIWKEMKNNYPMNKLLVGDVGSGKTIVAALACGLMANSGHKSVVLCPTQVLANQHFKTIGGFLSKFGIKVGLMTAKHKDEGQILIGTHALFGGRRDLEVDDLGLVVIDEEQRFGVLQRARFLRGKKWPHMLSLTATPIPRTIAMMNLGNVSYNYLSEKPKDRKEIKTHIVDDKKREGMFDFCEKRILENDERVFYVCPLVESGKKGRNAVSVYEELSNHWGAKISVGMLHGRTDEHEKNKIMTDFLEGRIQVLVSTTVIEVGVDIPRATVMIVDGAVNFGLSQLHQLRGRVGRDGSQGYCFLIANEGDDIERLEVLVKEHDGLKIAQKDLSLRGPGEVFGIDQSGRWDTNFEAFWDKKTNDNAKNIAQMIALDEQSAIKILTKINPSLANFDLPN